MILDWLDNWRQYGDLPYRIPAVIEYLLQTDVTRLSEDRQELDGDQVIALVQHRVT